MERTLGDETLGATPFFSFFDDVVAKRANKGGSAGGGATAATKGIGADGTNFMGASFFLRRKPAMDAVEGGSQKRRWI